MGIRGCSEHAEDFHSPLMSPVAMPGEAARPHAAPRNPCARLPGASWARGLLWGLPGPPASNWELAPVLRLGSPETLPAQPRPTLGIRLLTGLWR